MRELVFVRPDGTTHPLIALAQYLIVLALLGAGCVAVLQRVQYAWNWEAIWDYRALFWKGWVATIWISAGALVLSLLIGILGASALRSRFVFLRTLAVVYVELIRGTPLLVQIYLFFYMIFDVVQFDNRYIAGILILSLFSGAYVTEIIRAGIDSIGRSQWDSAMAVGFTPMQAYRYVILPQAARVLMPPLAGQLVSLIKDSSLLSVIAIEEFTLEAKSVASLTYSNFESYLPLAAGYLILTFPISMFVRWMAGRNRFET